MFGTVSIEKELIKEREQHDLLGKAKEVLNREFLIEQGILKDLSEENKGRWLNSKDLDPNKIHHISSIEKICIQHRLRFLDSVHYKGEIPPEAILAIKQLKKQQNLDDLDLYLIAPSKKFSLKDCDEDPLLFGRVSNKEYYLIHQWGKDLSWMRKWLFYPIRSLETLVISLLVLSVLVGMATPIEWIATDPLAYDNPYIRVAWILKLMVIFCAISALILSAFHKSLSSSQWQDHLFKR